METGISLVAGTPEKRGKVLDMLAQAIEERKDLNGVGVENMKPRYIVFIFVCHQLTLFINLLYKNRSEILPERLLVGVARLKLAASASQMRRAINCATPR